MKVAISGKGGVGKTTVAALLAAELVGRGYRVAAIDADPNPNLASALGFPPGPLTPLLELKDEIQERVGGAEGLIRLNPRVDDLVERVAVAHGGIRLIVAGPISRGGAGCACPQSVLVRRLLEHLVIERDEAVVIDLEAGLEHLGRRSAQAADALLVVVDGSRASLETAARIRHLASQIGMAQVLAVANRTREPADLDRLAMHLDGMELVGIIPYSDALAEGERQGVGAAGLDSAVSGSVARMADELESRLRGRVRR